MVSGGVDNSEENHICMCFFDQWSWVAQVSRFLTVISGSEKKEKFFNIGFDKL